MLIIAAVAHAEPPPVESVVLLTQGAATCAGAWVEPDLIATAYHCVAEGGPIDVQTRDGRAFRGKTVATSLRSDLALVRVDGAHGAPLAIKADPPAIGDAVTVIGHPFGARPPGGFMAGTLRWSASQGEVSAVGPTSLQVSAPINPGNSGGPVLDADGRIVAVVSRHLRGDGLGFAGRADALERLIQTPKGPKLLGGTYGAELVAYVWNGDRGTYSLGARGWLAIRDHVWFDVSGATAVSPRLEALVNQEVAWDSSEIRGGLRQRLFSGPYTLAFEGWGGLATIQTRTRDEERIDVRSGSEMLPIFGGSVRFPGLGISLDAGATLDGDLRFGVSASWPGMIGIF